jgi:choice-of-anchor B domain-containing protein
LEQLMRRFRLAAAILTLYALATPRSAAAQEPNFGRAVQLTAAELFIGQPVNWYGPGTVYTYRLDGAGAWQERTRLVAPDSSMKDDFGRALAVDGNTLVVGAPRKRDGAGVAYAFTRASGDAAWRHAATIEAPDDVDASEFAVSLALSGDDLLVGAPRADSAGVVHHYRRSGDDWRLHATIRPGRASGAAAFGSALHRHGDWLLIGAPASDSARGRAYAARRNADGSFAEPQLIALPQPETERANSGASVLIDGERAYVAAPGAATVHVLALDASGEWTATSTLTPNDSVRGSRFGHAVAVVASELWIGAPGINAGSGRVFRYTRAAERDFGTPVPLDADSADGTHWPFQFGYAIAAHGDRAVVGMPQRDFGEGRALVLTRAGDQWQGRQLLEGQIFRLGRDLTAGQRCEDGRIGEFTCANMQLVAYMQVDDLGGERGVWVNDVWGWTDPETRRDYALVARRDGASFVDVTDPANPKLIGNLPRTQGSPPSVWRDIKVIDDHAFIVADGSRAHGMQVFDLTRLRTVTDTPQVFTPDATYHEIFSAHNVVADTASKHVYVVGANSGGETCGGGLHMVDVRDPLNPRFVGCYNDASANNSRGYTHDAQCLVYDGPDQRYRGREICVGSNETEINIADVTDKANPVTLGRNSYPNVAYAHQGWFDDERRYFYMNDELDELAGHVTGTRTIVWDLSQLDDPVVAHEYIGPVPSSDHNLYVRGNRMYQSNYGSGLRVLDISDRTSPREIGFFDSAPYNEDEPGHSASASGAWSNYPFFDSGVVIFTSVREGLFIVRVIERVPAT